MTEQQTEHPFEIYRYGRADRWLQDAELDLLLGDLLQDELLWSVRPVRGLWSTFYGDQEGPLSVSERARDLRLRGALNARTTAGLFWRRLLPKIGPPRRLQAALDDGVLKLWTSENHRLALFGRARQPHRAVTLVAAAKSPRRLGATAVDLAREVAERTGAPVDALLAAFGQAYSLRRVVQDAIERTQPRAVITASTQHPFCRVAVTACRSLGVPSIYVPHAPTALNRTYADIPHDCGYLRGAADLDYYASLGADRGAMEIVGDPMFSLPEPREALGEPVVLLSTGADRPLEELEATLELVRAAKLTRHGRVVVAPHPRGRREVERYAPRFGFNVAGTRTSQVLIDSNVVVMLVERASGVSLEALAAGVPVLVLSLRRNYLFEVELGIPVVEEPNHLEAAVAELADRDPDERVYAEEVARFLSATGEVALQALMQRARQSSVTSSGVLDSWRWATPSEAR